MGKLMRELGMIYYNYNKSGVDKVFEISDFDGTEFFPL